MEQARRKINRKLLLIGLGLVALGILMPNLFNVSNFGVYRDLERALEAEEIFYVISAAARLLALNVLRAFPHYLGAFYIADALNLSQNRRHWLFYIPVIAIIVVLVYNFIELLYGIEYDLGVPAVLMMLFLILLVRIDFSLVPPVKKAIMVFFLLCAVQCLDVMPMLNGYSFGRGETSEDIKDIAVFLGADKPLDMTMALLVCIMGINVVLYTILVMDENHIKLASLQRQQQERELMEARMRALEARTHLELGHLVHDLKTPLTAIQALVGIVKLGEQDPNRVEQLDRVELSVDRMNELISEFLDEEHFSRTTAREIVTDLQAQISDLPYALILQCELPDEELWLEVNKIRVSRALVNLLENAYYAVDPEHGRIWLRVFRVAQDGMNMICFALSDNGKGMDKATQESVFESGYSTRGSSGLGLSFVREVVECHEGTIEMESEPGKGTTFRICLPEGL